MTALEVAKSQIGYKESPAGSNRTKYGAWYGMDGVPWCMIFVQWCFSEAGTPLPFKTASCSGLLDWFRKNDLKCLVDAPKPGDVVIYTFGHCGIVSSEMDAGVFRTVEGNTSLTSDDNGGAVMERLRRHEQVEAFIHPFADVDGDDGKNGDGLVLPMLEKGSKGDSVRALQFLLLGWGYSVGKWGADGDFGEDTARAVRLYQWQHGLENDGIVGPLTWSSLLGM